MVSLILATYNNSIASGKFLTGGFLLQYVLTGGSIITGGSIKLLN
jgi:hypothetical protein